MKRLGIPDSQIILMLADDVACNPRNPFAGTVYSNADRKTDLYGERIEVDYKGEEVNVENFLRLLSGAFCPASPVTWLPLHLCMTRDRLNLARDAFSFFLPAQVACPIRRPLRNDS